MRKLAAAAVPLILALSTTGCASRAAAVAEGSAAILAASLAATANDCHDEFICLDFRPALYTTAAVYGTAAVVSWVRADQAEAPQPGLR
jgi:hypothetical protein